MDTSPVHGYFAGSRDTAAPAHKNVGPRSLERGPTGTVGRGTEGYRTNSSFFTCACWPVLSRYM